MCTLCCTRPWKQRPARSGSVTRQWVREFMLQGEMLYRKHVIRQRVKFSVEEVAADHRVYACVCNIPGQQAARAELSTRSLGLPDRCCSCHINRGSTSVAQPADIGVMKPFKDALATVCGNFFATTLLNTICAGGCVVLSDSLAQNRNHMHVWVNEAVLALQSRERIYFNSWRHIVDHDPAQVLDKARQHMAEGALFRNGKRGQAPHEIATRCKKRKGRGRPSDPRR